MTPLTQQLEDKKKELSEVNGRWDEDRSIDYEKMRILEAEIAILEQAIAEMQKQSQQTKPLEFVETDRGCKPISLTGITRCNSSKDKTADISNLLQKQRQDFEKVLNRIIGKIQDSRNNGEMIIDYCKKIKQQLNQPKTEE